MVEALAVVVIIGVVVPVGAWLFSRRLEARRRPETADGLGPPADRADQWLIERHRLPALKRWEVRQAVIYGRAVGDLVLRNAARDLAGGVLSGEVNLGRGIRVLAGAQLAEGIMFTAAGTLVLVKTGSPLSVFVFLLSPWYLGTGIMLARTARHGAERAYRLNAPAARGA